MRYRILIVLLAALAIGCSDSEDINGQTNNPTQSDCPDAVEVEADGDKACVYQSELIEEGFACPSALPNGFNLMGGGVACVAGEIMPPGLGGQLIEEGFVPVDDDCFGMNPADTCFFGETPTPVERAFNLDDPQTFSYTAEGPCPNIGAITNFELDFSTGLADIDVWIEGDESDPDCVDLFDGTCAVVQSHTDVQISSEDVQTLVTLLEAVPVKQCPEPGPDQPVCDAPCLSERYTVDGDFVSPFCCGEAANNFGPAIQAVQAHLETLIPDAPEPGDFLDASGYLQLDYSVRPGEGYCIDDGQIIEATIIRQGPGGPLELSGIESIADDSDPDACIPETTHPDHDCLVESEFGPIILTETQADDLEALLAAVPAPMCERDEELACDPCLVETIEVDEVTADGFCCGTTAAGFSEAFADVVDYLQTLK